MQLSPLHQLPVERRNEEAMPIKWCGIDFGQTLLEPSGMRTYLIIGDVYKTLGRPEMIPAAVNRFRILVEFCGNVNILKEAHRDKIKSYVLGGDPQAVSIFEATEKDYMGVAAGAEEVFLYMRERGISVNIVAELRHTLGDVANNIISQYLRSKKLTGYFDCLYAPQGKINLQDGSIDDRYKGKTKESGELYEMILEYLDEQDIKPQEMLMVGDQIKTDINPPRRFGIRTVQYTGYEDLGDSQADHRVSSFSELREFLKEMGI